MEWILDEHSREFVSACGNYAIKNAGEKGGVLYGVFALAEFIGDGKKHQEHIRLVKSGTLSECKQFQPGV